MRRLPDTSGRCRRGGILFEVVVSLALFGAAAAFTLGAVRSVFHSLRTSQLQQQAIDLARSKMAELEAGLITLADLRGQSGGSGIGSFDTLDREVAGGGSAAGQAPLRWAFELKTHRTEFTGLSLIELTVREDRPAQDDPAATPPVQFTLRQLVALREVDAESYHSDTAVDRAEPPVEWGRP